MDESLSKDTDGLIDSISKIEDPEAMTKYQKLMTDVTGVLSGK